MTWAEILVLLVMVMGLIAIDMLVAKLNLTAGRIVAVLTLFVMMPLGLVAGIVALVCMNSKGKQWKFSITAFCENVLFHAFLLVVILLYLIDMMLLKIFPDATFPVVFFSICFSPLFIIVAAKVLDYLKEKIRKPKKIDLVTIFKHKNEEIPPVVPEKPRKTATNHSSGSFCYETSDSGALTVDKYLFLYDRDAYQDYLQGNIRPERYRNIHLIRDSAYFVNEVKPDRGSDIRNSKLYPYYQQYLKRHPDTSFEAFENDVRGARQMEYETPHDDPGFRGSIDPSDPKWLHPRHPIEQRLAKNGESYWVEV